MRACKMLSNEFKKNHKNFSLKKHYQTTTQTLLINDPESDLKKNLRQYFYPGL